MGYRLDGRGSIPSRGKYFSLLRSVQTGFEVHPAYPMGTWGFFLGVKRLWRESDHSLLSSAKVKNDGAIPPFLHVFMAECLIS
jgi:hypothetical protein